MRHGLRVGGYARLKSGGPTMVILELNGSMALCRWRDGQEQESIVLPVSALEPVAILNEETGEDAP